jgi:hypothetical protein
VTDEGLKGFLQSNVSLRRKKFARGRSLLALRFLLVSSPAEANGIRSGDRREPQTGADKVLLTKNLVLNTQLQAWLISVDHKG